MRSFGFFHDFHNIQIFVIKARAIHFWFIYLLIRRVKSNIYLVNERSDNFLYNKHIDEGNVNDSIAIFLKLFDSVLDKHAPFKLMTNKEMKLRDKPWITSGILKSIKIKDSTHKKYIKAKNAETNLFLKFKSYNLFLKFKSYRNSVSNLLKLSKKNYYTEYFKPSSNINNIKGTWKGIKEQNIYL